MAGRGRGRELTLPAWMVKQQQQEGGGGTGEGGSEGGLGGGRGGEGNSLGQPASEHQFEDVPPPRRDDGGMVSLGGVGLCFVLRDSREMEEMIYPLHFTHPSLPPLPPWM